VIGTDEVPAEEATVILQTPRQEGKALPGIGELRDGLVRRRHRRVGSRRPLIRRRCGEPAAAQHSKRQAKGPQRLHHDPPPCRQEDPLGIWRTSHQCIVNKQLPLLVIFRLPDPSDRRCEVKAEFSWWRRAAVIAALRAGQPSARTGRPRRKATRLWYAYDTAVYDTPTALAVTALAATPAPRPGNDAPSGDVSHLNSMYTERQGLKVRRSGTASIFRGSCDFATSFRGPAVPIPRAGAIRGFAR